MQEAAKARERNEVWIPDPAHCILAIQEARKALAHSPDDWVAFRRLKDAYAYLMFQENAMLYGVPITHENGVRILRLQPKAELLMNRMQQRAAALNYAIQTTPPPKNAAERVEKAGLNLELSELYFQIGARDMGRDCVRAFVEGVQPGDYTKEMMDQIKRQLSEFDEAVKKVNDSVEDFEVERSAGPVDRGTFALNQGNTGRAIAELADAERNLVSTAVVKPRLVDLYCNTGQPDKALELLSTGALEDPNLGVEPGAGAFRQGRVYFLLGNYLSAATLWRERAIPRVRAERSGRVLMSAVGLTRGESLQTTNAFLGLPTSLSQQAAWLYDLGMCQLEAGMPNEAAESLTSALTLAPGHWRPADRGVLPREDGQTRSAADEADWCSGETRCAACGSAEDGPAVAIARAPSRPERASRRQRNRLRQRRGLTRRSLQAGHRRVPVQSPPRRAGHKTVRVRACLRIAIVCGAPQPGPLSELSPRERERWGVMSDSPTSAGFCRSSNSQTFSQGGECSG